MSNVNDDLNMLINVRNNIKSSLTLKGENPSNDIRTYANNIQNIYVSSSGINISDGTKFKNSTVMNFPQLDFRNVTNTYAMFTDCTNLVVSPIINTSNIINTGFMFANCYNLVDVKEFDTSNVMNMRSMFTHCNNLSNESIQNIINMCINGVNVKSKYLSNSDTSSPFYVTKFDSSYYLNRLDELTAAGWIQ